MKNIIIFVSMILSLSLTSNKGFAGHLWAIEQDTVNIYQLNQLDTLFVCYSQGLINLQGGDSNLGSSCYSWDFPSGIKVNFIEFYNVSNEGGVTEYGISLFRCDGNNRIIQLIFVNPPAINNQPISLTKTVGQSATFSVSASVDYQTLSYQWQKNGNNINEATSNTLTINNLNLTDNGNYTCIITTNHCGSVTSNIAHLTVNCGSVVTHNLNSAICQGDSIFVGGHYQTTTGTYRDTLQNIYGCDSLIKVTSLTINHAPTVALYQDTITLEVGQALDLYTSTTGNPTNYSWSTGETASWITVHPTSDTVYHVTVSNTCGTATDAVTVLTITHITQNKMSTSVNIFPNPTRNYFTIAGNDLTIKEIRITNLEGEIVFQIIDDPKLKTIDISILQNGIYIINILTTEGLAEPIRLIKIE